MNQKFTIAIGSDHAGFKYKEAIKAWLFTEGHTVRDFGTDSETPVDFPDFIRPVAQAVAAGEFERGIVLGGSGNGEAIAANKVKGVRAALALSAHAPSETSEFEKRLAAEGLQSRMNPEFYTDAAAGDAVGNIM